MAFTVNSLMFQLLPVSLMYCRCDVTLIVHFEVIYYIIAWSDNSSREVSGAGTEMSCSCSNEIGITIGTTIVAVFLVFIVITILVVLCLYR